MSLACAVAMAAVVTGQGREDGLVSLADAERAFAKLSVRTSQREAFLANFADEGVWFDPGPSNTKAALAKSAAPTSARKRSLDWEPVTGDIALSSELGYTTGPYTLTEDGKTIAEGWFFSVWRRPSGGQWKVVADFGIPVASGSTLRPREFKAAEVHGVRPAGLVGEDAAKTEIETAEREFAERAGRDGLQAACRDRGTDDLRLYRPNDAPLVGRLAAAASMPSLPTRLQWQPSHVSVSTAGDLAYSYGAYAIGSDSGGTATKGFYLHVWKRRPEGWRLAVDVTNVER
jgi:ketosteroid isomerase-like protein